jgi:hypothetical protein
MNGRVRCWMGRASAFAEDVGERVAGDVGERVAEDVG